MFRSFRFSDFIFALWEEKNHPKTVKMVSRLLNPEFHFSTWENISSNGAMLSFKQSLRKFRYLCKYATDQGFHSLISKTTPTFPPTLCNSKSWSKAACVTLECQFIAVKTSSFYSVHLHLSQTMRCKFNLKEPHTHNKTLYCNFTQIINSNKLDWIIAIIMKCGRFSSFRSEFVLNGRACRVGKRVDLGKLGSSVCDSCGPCSIRVGLPVSPPLYVQHQYEHHPVSLKGESVLFDWVELLYVTLTNIIISMTFHCCRAARNLVIRPQSKSTFGGVNCRSRSKLMKGNRLKKTALCC